MVRIRDESTAPRAGLRRAARIAGIVVLVALAVVDVASWNIAPAAAPWSAPVLALALAAVLWPAGRRPRRLTPELRVLVPAVASLLFTAGDRLAGVGFLGGPGEALALLCLLLIAVRTIRSPLVAPVAATAALAVVVLPLRMTPVEPRDPGDQLGAAVVLALVAAVFAGLGGYLRVADARRRAAVARVRRAERLAIAADLHDFVAHHVTGILVQAQMGQAVLDLQPERLGPILRGIERAAGETLASMRRTVDVLRDEPDATSAPRSAGDLAALPGLVEDFNRAGPPVTLRPHHRLPEDLPREVQAAAYRVVQEALTNVRRHGADAGEVTVELRYAGGTLTVVVRDDGTTAGAGAIAHGSGFGLTGLDERVTALGGRLRAGPRPGRGWELVAELPATGVIV